MKKNRWFAVFTALALAFTMFGCKPEIQYVDKTYCESVTFASEATENGVKVTMATATKEAVIYYTTDGKVPTAESTKYSEAVEFTKDVTVKAIAVKKGLENSPVSVATVSIKEKTVEVAKEYCAAVTFASEATENGVKVTMATATKEAVIYYTTDGKAPTAESTKYSEAVEFTKDATVKAIAVKNGLENSPVSVATVSIKEKTITVEVEKKVDETAPASVTNLAAKVKDSRILLTWTDAADEDIYGYEVSYNGTKPINRVVLPALDSTSMMVPQGAGGTYVSGLTNGTEYTFTVKTVDTSGNKSEGVTVKGTPEAQDASETLKIALTTSVPQENDYTGNKSNTKVTVTAAITTASSVKKVVWKKDGSLIAKTLLADEDAEEATVSDDNAVWTFDITATDETANGTYTVAAIDEAGREEAEQITINNFDFTAPSKVKVTSGVYSSELTSIIFNWTEPSDADYDHVDITFTSNDGTADSTPSATVTVNKGTTNKTFSDIDGAKAYYTYTFVTYDELGNKGAEYTHKVSVNTTVSNIPEGFVEVTGTIITGTETWTPESEVFVSGRQLTIKDMYVSDHEVTQAEYEKYCKYGSSSPRSSLLGSGDNYPAYYVNWYDAIVYCNLRSIAEGLTPAYKIGEETDSRNWSGIVGDATNGYCGPSSSNDIWNALTYDTEADDYRLPTEAEWEYIAREAGKSTTTYSGSDTIYDVAWCSNNSRGSTHKVKGKKANSLGIYDMSGNVLEWCYDWTDTGASSGSSRVKRGGYWNYFDSCCAVSYRYSSNPDRRDGYCGFRVVRSKSVEGEDSDQNTETDPENPEPIEPETGDIDIFIY